jgi:hypothetical protein
MYESGRPQPLYPNIIFQGLKESMVLFAQDLTGEKDYNIARQGLILFGSRVAIQRQVYFHVDICRNVYHSIVGVIRDLNSCIDPCSI